MSQLAQLVQHLANRLRRTAVPEMERTLIVGLGNPGPKYAQNRHNVGFQCVEHIARAHGIALHRERLRARLGEGQIEGCAVVLAQPQTFMNDSGQSVAPLSRWYKIPPERLLVIYDDLDLPLGRLRLRPNGGSGGHNGIRSIIALLGTQDFARLRVGIGRPTHGEPVDYVLNDFSPEQTATIQAAYARVEEIVRCVLARGVHEAMDRYNRVEMSQL